MSILVVGASHRTAPLDLLERLVLDDGGARKALTAALASPHVAEAVVLSTCNRVEVYAEVDRFHGAVDDLTELLMQRADSGVDLTPHLTVHFDAAAVSHLFSVAAGLRSMVVGESQVLGQVRGALRLAQEELTVGPSLNALFQHALHVGKRAHTETAIGSTGRSLVTVALDSVLPGLGDPARLRVGIVGAGSIASLAALTAQRTGVTDITVASRTRASAERVAGHVSGRAVDIASLPDLVADVDLLISCTGAQGVVVPESLVRRVVERRRTRPLAIVDLALPHDVDPPVAELDGVRLVALRDLFDDEGRVGTDRPRSEQPTAGTDIPAVETLVANEVAAFASARAAARVAPTVVALRGMATSVVDAELDRLWGRSSDLTAAQRAEIAATVHRVADKLLHEPTVRVKQLVGQVPESSYADALAELFALDRSTVEAVSTPPEPGT